ncbi:IST1 [Lepeophtheirus salmonis]|uniref:IST1 homolog n=1 Tax=Lepeophtheirus salmonis TaxID=72036 RepID=A0A7R8D0U7_LEPSM|nr:IST1 [Lepeophtheirus salmonis]CAF2987900.1 IST1 [Lepeophtheirus salmonis]
MFSSKPNYSQLKTNLKICMNRLKLLQKKKTELAMKSRAEIADLIATGKIDRAKIRVEHIIREDYLVEAMELVELYCDLLLARFGLLQSSSQVDCGLVEAVSSLIWSAPRLSSDVQELTTIAKQLSLKYGEPFAQVCRENRDENVSERIIHKLSVEAPPKLTVEKYLIEIAKYYDVTYEPDPQVMKHDAEQQLIDIGIPNLPFIPAVATAPAASIPFNYPQPSVKTIPAARVDDEIPPPYYPSSKEFDFDDDDKKMPFPDLPDIPSDSSRKSTPELTNKEDEIDLDDLTRRFEELKKRK